LTGGVTTEVFSTNILDKEYFWKEEIMKVNQDFLFGCSSCVFWGRGKDTGYLIYFLFWHVLEVVRHVSTAFHPEAKRMPQFLDQ